MKIVIDISEDDYRKVQDGRASVSMMRKAIRNGTPLPKGYGRLIDADKLIKDNGLDKATKYGNKTKEQLQFSYDTMMMYEIFGLIDDAEIVVEADENEY